MGSCLGKIFNRGESHRGYDRASRNAEDAFDSDSDAEEPLLVTERETPASGVPLSEQTAPALQVDGGDYHDEDSDDDDNAHRRANPDINPDTLDELAEAAMRANMTSDISSALGTDLDLPTVPDNTPAEGNLLHL